MSQHYFVADASADPHGKSKSTSKKSRQGFSPKKRHSDEIINYAIQLAVSTCPAYSTRDIKQKIYDKFKVKISNVTIATWIKGANDKSEIDWEKIENLFTDKYVVTFEELEPLMPKDSFEFWEEGMFGFLSAKNFEIIPFRDKDGFLSEIYVNFEGFRTLFQESAPIIKISGQASKHPKITEIKDKMTPIARKLDKKTVTINIHNDKIQILFSGNLTLSDGELKTLVLDKLSKEMKLEFERE